VSHAPVLLFVYNRPRHTRETVEALQKNTFAPDSDLVVYSDAPRTPETASAVQEVRKYIHTVDGFASITIVERPANLGLANSIIDGVTRHCRERGRAIVVEDDLVTSPYFLEYMNAALKRYEHETRVMQVAGYMFPVALNGNEDALLLPFITSWGWATWQRAWAHFDPDAKGYDQLAGDRAMRRQFDLDGHYGYFRMLRAQRNGQADSWAIRWYLSVFLHQGLALFPSKTLVRNLGFDGSGVNCSVSEFKQDELDMQFRVTSMPESVGVSPALGRVLESMPSPRLRLSSILNRIQGVSRHVMGVARDAVGGSHG
jgi:hypothetical protein